MIVALEHREEIAVSSKRSGWLHSLEVSLGLLSGFLTFVMMLLVCLQISLRVVLNTAIPGLVEGVELMMAAVVFAGMPLLQASNGHVRMDIVVNRLRGRAHGLLEGFAFLIVLVVFAVMCWKTADFAWQGWLMKESTIGMVRIPVWPVRAVLPITTFVVLLRLLLQFGTQVAEVIRPGAGIGRLAPQRE